ncbi:MAG: histidine kinase [Haliea sp.]|uniref:sensor histidine kinase n=1 Tax=Haliea sp. TaxID=1932666 RepID=UPI0032EE91A9
MGDAKEQQAAAASARASGEFFIPDLCAPRSVFFLVLLSELVVLIHTLVVSRLPSFDWAVFASGSLLVQWLVLFSAVLLCALRSWFARRSLFVAAAGSILLVLLVTALSSQLVLGFFAQWLGPGDRHWWLLRNLLVAGLVAGIALRYFYLQQQLALRERSELQARLDAMQTRIRPHFLFNTLNSIASLIASHPERAEEAVEDLAELFRASLRQSGVDATVADELRLCQLYLGIEQLRLGERLRLDWQIEEGLAGLPMPGLVLQPLVENAVYHGVSLLPGGGTVSVHLARQGGELVAAVENPVPERPGISRGENMALNNIEQRLQALFGDDASLRRVPAQGRFRVELRYPLEAQP